MRRRDTLRAAQKRCVRLKARVAELEGLRDVIEKRRAAITKLANCAPPPTPAEQRRDHALRIIEIGIEMLREPS